MTEPPLLLSPGQASERLGVGRSAVYQLVRAGRLAAVRPLSDAGELRFRDADLVAFVAALEAVDPASTPTSVSEAPARRLAAVPRRRRTPRPAA